MPAAQGVLEGPPAPRVCGRCRLVFVGDATMPQGLEHGWWACAPCRERLMGAGATPSRSWPARKRS